ncbi:glycosyltransferase family 39 protein, partial [Patescibacteria group bacterium]|nr:glycosyltransferase family 39 protein [Patescibacteria group bacterium]
MLIIFIAMAAILRFYYITRLEFFTYDQARDALFVKRMIVDRQWRLLGTQTSLPGMYLPPFYFYTIAPVLWLFKLNPAGIDIYSAFIGVLTVPLAFYVANKLFGRPAGVFSAGLFAVSPIVVELTRRAWNCNTMPFYILLAFYFVYRYFKEKRLKDYLLAFVFYGYCLSLHFGAWTLMPLFVFIWAYSLTKKGQIKFKNSLLAILILFFFVSPLLIFELRHNFFLFSQAKMFFFDGGYIGPAAGNFFESFVSSLLSIFTIIVSGKIDVGYGAPLEFSGKLKDFFVPYQQISVVAQKPFSLTYQWWGLGIFILIFFYSIYKFYNFYKNYK